MTPNVKRANFIFSETYFSENMVFLPLSGPELRLFVHQMNANISKNGFTERLLLIYLQFANHLRLVLGYRWR